MLLIIKSSMQSRVSEIGKAQPPVRLTRNLYNLKKFHITTLAISKINLQVLREHLLMIAVL